MAQPATSQYEERGSSVRDRSSSCSRSRMSRSRRCCGCCDLSPLLTSVLLCPGVPSNHNYSPLASLQRQPVVAGEQSTVASSQFRDITFQTVSSVSSSYLLHPCRPPCPHPPLGPLFIFIPPCSPQQGTTAPLVLATTLRCSTWTFEYLDI